MSQTRRVLLYGMAGLYFLAGINHFVNPGFYKKMMPPFLPVPDTLICISGAAEMIGGLLLIPPVTRRWAAAGIIILLIVVFPANIQMMLNYREQHHPFYWLTLVRLPVQLVLVAWAWLFVKRGPPGGKEIISS